MTVARAIPLAHTRALRHAVLRPHESIAELADRERDAFAVGVFEDDELVAVGYIVPGGDAGSWRVRGMATVPHARGRGAGSEVLRALIAYAEERGATRVWCNARTPARRLYERAGFRAVSEQFELPGIGPHVVMELWRDAAPA